MPKWRSTGTLASLGSLLNTSSITSAVLVNLAYAIGTSEGYHYPCYHYYNSRQPLNSMQTYCASSSLALNAANSADWDTWRSALTTHRSTN